MTLIKGSDWGGSRMTTAQTCKQKYYYENEIPHPEGGSGLVMIQSKLAPTKGTLLHAGLQRFYELKKHQSERPYMDRVVESITHCVNCCKEFDIDEAALPLLKEELIATLDQYCTKYEVEDLEPVAVEQPVTVDVGLGQPHTGIIDLLARWHDVLYVVDHKTTSMQLGFLFKKLRFDLSLKGYAIAASKALGEAVHVLINGIRFKGNKALECEFDREPIHYNDDERAEFIPTIRSIRREISACQDEGFWPKSGSQCVQIWGECDYRKLCTYPDPATVKTFYRARRKDATATVSDVPGALGS